MSNTPDIPPRCLRSQHTSKAGQEPPQSYPLPGGAGGSPAGLTSNLPMFCSSLTLLPERYCQARPRSEGGIPFWHRSRICGRDTAVTGKPQSTGKQRDSWGKVGARPAPWSPAASQTRRSVPEPLGCRDASWNGSQGCTSSTGELPEVQQRLCGLQTAPNKPGTASKPDPAGSWKSKHWSQGGEQSALSTWEALRTQGRVPSPQSSPPLPCGAMESRDGHSDKGLSPPTCSSWAEGQVWSYLHAWPDPEAPEASSMPRVSCALVSLALGTSQGQSPGEAVGAYLAWGAEPA